MRPVRVSRASKGSDYSGTMEDNRNNSINLEVCVKHTYLVLCFTSENIRLVT